FDAYIKCLDEFRARRLGKKRLSLSADELRNRADLPFVNFDDIMQADFILCIYGLLHRPQALTHWFPRTVVYAEPYEQRGFDLFFRAQSKSFFATIALLLEVRDKTELLDLFETARRQCRLDQWKIGAAPIPFASYMGLSALATT
ncbi:MAG: hypothetical protein KJO55_06925, partial [Gammaproteobacteria bacterium]|nr:hypothetical protein [Gammaproteobacteria bacterium]